MKTITISLLSTLIGIVYGAIMTLCFKSNNIWIGFIAFLMVTGLIMILSYLLFEFYDYLIKIKR